MASIAFFHCAKGPKVAFARAKATFSGVSHPATAPAGIDRIGHGEVAKASCVRRDGAAMEAPPGERGGKNLDHRATYQIYWTWSLKVNIEMADLGSIRRTLYR